MSLLKNCRIENIEKAIYIIDTLNLKGNQTDGYPLTDYKDTGQSLVVDDSPKILDIEKGGEEMAEWRPRQGLRRLIITESEFGEAYYNVTKDIDWNDPDLDWDNEDIQMAYQEYVERFGEFEFEEEEEEEDDDFYADEDESFDFDEVSQSNAVEIKPIQSTVNSNNNFNVDEENDDDFYSDEESDDDFYADEEDDEFDDDFYDDEENQEFDFSKVSQSNEVEVKSSQSSFTTTKNSDIDIEELKKQLRQEIMREVEEKHQKEIDTYKIRLNDANNVIQNKNKEIESYKAQLSSKVDELNKLKSEKSSSQVSSVNSQELVEVKEKLKNTNKELQDTVLENIKLKKYIKSLSDSKATNNTSVNNVKPNYDEMKLKELALHVKKFMLRNGCKEKPVDKQLLITEFGATNVNRLVIQRFLVQKNNGYIL